MGFYYRITLISLLALSHICISVAHGSTKQNHPPSAVIIGTVNCNSCFHQSSSRNIQRISGASVMVECSNLTTKSSFREVVKTDKDGVFRVLLPSKIGKHIKKINECSVKLISSNEPFCAMAASATSFSFHLRSTKNKVHVFSSGFFTFRPLNQPELCNQRPNVEGSSNFDASKDTEASSPLPSLNIPPLPHLPQLPALPNLPTLPNLPNLPQLPPPTTPSNPFFPGIPRQLPKDRSLLAAVAALLGWSPTLDANGRRAEGI